MKFRYLGYFWVSLGFGVFKFNGGRYLFKASEVALDRSKPGIYQSL